MPHDRTSVVQSTREGRTDRALFLQSTTSYPWGGITMQQTLGSRLAPIGRVAVAAALLIGGNAIAGSFMGEAGFGYGSGGKISKGDEQEHGSALLFDGAFGYRFDTG